MPVTPGHAHLHAIKILHHNNFWLRDNLYRDTAPVPATKFVPVINSWLRSNLYRDHTSIAIKFVPGWQKHVPYPPCTVTAFVAKVPGPCPDASSGNTTSPYCRAVIFKVMQYLVLKKVDTFLNNLRRNEHGNRTSTCGI